MELLVSPAALPRPRRHVRKDAVPCARQASRPEAPDADGAFSDGGRCLQKLHANRMLMMEIYAEQPPERSAAAWQGLSK